jgi:cytochrome c oxidase cbb3-type subunit III
MKVILCLCAAALLLGCEREKRRFEEGAPSAELVRSERQRSSIVPGEPDPSAAPAPARAPVLGKLGEERNAWAMNEGKRLYVWFNCVGCHANGGGGMGPPLIDDEWRYGVRPEDIYTTIVEGRPNGMPSFRGKITEQQAWQLVAYVRSMSGQVPRDAAPSRADDMSVKQQESMKGREKPRQEHVEPPR